jgi:hypothetical protein
LPRTLWYPKKPDKRTTTGDFLCNVRTQLFCRAVNMNFSGFVSQENYLRAVRNRSTPWANASFFARN